MINKTRVAEITYLFGGNREVAIQRDGERCVKCGLTRDEHKERYGKDLTVDHIDRNGKNVLAIQKNNSLGNLQTLCFVCHGQKSFMDKNQPRSTHGMLSMYTNHKCRCATCRAVWLSYMNQYKKRRKVLVG